jgi:hypothetical protein
LPASSHTASSQGPHRQPLHTQHQVRALIASLFTHSIKSGPSFPASHTQHQGSQLRALIASLFTHSIKVSSLGALITSFFTNSNKVASSEALIGSLFSLGSRVSTKDLVVNLFTHSIKVSSSGASLPAFGVKASSSVALIYHKLHTKHQGCVHLIEFSLPASEFLAVIPPCLCTNSCHPPSPLPRVCQCISAFEVHIL